MSQSSSPPRRRRGAPPGNLNALKHGFYSRLFRAAELSDLQKSHAEGLQDEIDMLRLLIHRAMDLGKDVTDLEAFLRLLTAVSRSTAQLGRLARFQHLIFAPADELSLAFKRALHEMTQELALENTLDPSVPPGEN